MIRSVTPLLRGGGSVVLEGTMVSPETGIADAPPSGRFPAAGRIGRARKSGSGAGRVKKSRSYVQKVKESRSFVETLKENGSGMGRVEECGSDVERAEEKRSGGGRR